MKASNLSELYIAKLRDLHDSSCQVIDTLPKSARCAQSKPLSDLFKGVLDSTKAQKSRLSDIFEELEEKPTGGECKVTEFLGKHLSDPKVHAEGPIYDAAMADAMGGIQRHLISGYGSALSYAKALGNDSQTILLKQTLNELHTSSKSLLGLVPGVLESETPVPAG